MSEKSELHALIKENIELTNVLTEDVLKLHGRMDKLEERVRRLYELNAQLMENGEWKWREGEKKENFITFRPTIAASKKPLTREQKAEGVVKAVKWAE